MYIDYVAGDDRKGEVKRSQWSGQPPQLPNTGLRLLKWVSYLAHGLDNLSCAKHSHGSIVESLKSCGKIYIT